MCWDALFNLQCLVKYVRKSHVVVCFRVPYDFVLKSSHPCAHTIRYPRQLSWLCKRNQKQIRLRFADNSVCMLEKRNIQILCTESHDVNVPSLNAAHTIPPDVGTRESIARFVAASCKSSPLFKLISDPNPKKHAWECHTQIFPSRALLHTASLLSARAVMAAECPSNSPTNSPTFNGIS